MIDACYQCPYWIKFESDGTIGRCSLGGGVDSGDRGPCGLDIPDLDIDGEQIPDPELEITEEAEKT